MTTTQTRSGVGHGLRLRRWSYGAAALAGAAAWALWVVMDVRYWAGAGAGPSGELRPAEVGIMVAAGVAVFSFDTTVLIALAGTLVALRPAADSRASRWLTLAALLSLVMAVVVYQLTIPAEEKLGRTGLLLAWDVLAHYVAPALLLLAWLVTGPRPRFDARLLGLVLLWPVGYLAYMLGFARLTGVYPYDFLDPGAVGPAGVVAVSVGLFLTFVVVGALMLLLDRRLPSQEGDSTTVP